MKAFLISTLLLLHIQCSSEDVSIDEILGLYASGSEISGFTSTKLYISKNSTGKLEYQKVFHTDVISTNSIKQDFEMGEIKYIAGTLIIANANGYFRDGKPFLYSTIDIYYPVKVNGFLTLMRSGSYNAWKVKGMVYDYGILVRAADNLEKPITNISIKPIIMSDVFGIDKWKDPFVNGANKVK